MPAGGGRPARPALRAGGLRLRRHACRQLPLVRRRVERGGGPLRLPLHPAGRGGRAARPGGGRHPRPPRRRALEAALHRAAHAAPGGP
ncbi:hypothetical protein HVPorG_05024 [Roseomonas mucosa]|uniref:Uncharacterized protein n=1 Tax=Roseomonas mucosa TaxID=207340 RepID=A0A4Y1N3T8_9PROT|nr:hypothetical protein RADP37_05024 [Roseomonas mucosa]QDJ11412.1 hypothetical protein HVPorG_05024 [Roseomonas mucosa]UZO98725.1 hypothetical protein RMHFA_05024 [Roseomonas mucosa]